MKMETTSHLIVEGDREPLLDSATDAHSVQSDGAGANLAIATHVFVHHSQEDVI